jgi:hypothetical protein
MAMLPRLKQWLEQALGDAPPRPTAADGDEGLSTLLADDRLSVSESTITEFSRAIATLDTREAPRT